MKRADTVIEEKIKRLLQFCSEIDFGAVNLSDGEKKFCSEMNQEVISLCNSLPESTHRKALNSFKKNFRIPRGQKFSFSINYYVPSWSILYWLFQSLPDNKGLQQENRQNAKTAHAMALILHPLDDHLNDGQIPATYLAVLLRSQAWMIMTAALSRLAEGTDKGTEIVRRFINKYYSGITGSKNILTLENYCDLFRMQMATWLIVPVLMAKKISNNKEFTNSIQVAYESFGIAWRLLDDIKDIEIDMKRGAKSSVYTCLPDELKHYWARPGGKEWEKKDCFGIILEYILENRVIERIRELIGHELNSAASIAEECNLTSWADEFHSLLRPLKPGAIMSGRVDAKSYPDVIKERISIEVTTRCNINCSHCFARAGISEPSDLSPKLVKEIMTEGYNVGYRHFHITGGEPLLWEGLSDVLDYAFDMGYQTGFMNTNGTLLTGEISARLATYPDLSISVSMEGTEALHKHLRGVGSYHRTVRGIEKALGSGINLFIFTTACKSLLPDLPHFADELYKKFPGIKYLTLIQLIPVMDEAFSLSAELLDPEDFLQLIKKVSLLNLLGLSTRFLNNPLAYVASKLLKTLWIPQSEPLYSEGSMMVLANRNICLSHSSRVSFGKYESGMIEKVLDSDRYRKAVRPDEKTCPSCKYADLCSENGLIRPSEWCGDIRSDVPFCQKVLDSQKNESENVCEAIGLAYR